MDAPAGAARPLRVLVVAKGYPAFDVPGRGSFVADQVAALLAAGHHVTVAAWETVPGGDASEAAHAAEAVWLDAVRDRVSAPTGHRWGPSVPVAWLPGIAIADGAGKPDLAATADREAAWLAAALDRLPGAPFDVIHAHTGLTVGAAAAMVARKAGLPIVVTEHDSTLRDRLADPAARALYATLLAPGCRLVAVSSALARALEERFSAAPGTVRVIPDVVDVAAFPAATGPRRTGELLWVGARHAGKGTDVLLAALAELRRGRPGVHLRLIGRATSEAEEARIHALAEALGVADAVSFEPPADRASVAAAMARADVFVHPSAYETFGIVAAEAISSGLPVAATPSGGVPSTVGTDGSLGEVAVDHTPAALAEAVRRVLDRRATFDPVAMHRAIEAQCAPSAVAASIVTTFRELGAGVKDVPAEIGAHAATPASLLDGPIVVLAMRRNVAAARMAALPPELASGIVAVTSAAQGPHDAALPSGPRWVEIDPERGFREARARLGGVLPVGTLPARIGRVVRHPVRTLRRRSLYQQRAEFRDRTMATDLRDAIVAAGAGAPVTVVPSAMADVVPILPLLGDRLLARLAPTTLRGLAQAWDASGGPALAKGTPSAEEPRP